MSDPRQRLSHEGTWEHRRRLRKLDTIDAINAADDLDTLKKTLVDLIERDALRVDHDLS